MRTNSRAKGARGEREWAKWLRDELGLQDARRGRQFAGGPDSPDVVDGIPGTHAEVKRVEHLNLYNAVKQALSECGSGIPYVAHRRNGQPWLVTVLARDLVAFSGCVLYRGDVQCDDDEQVNEQMRSLGEWGAKV